MDELSGTSSALSKQSRLCKISYLKENPPTSTKFDPVQSENPGFADHRTDPDGLEVVRGPLHWGSLISLYQTHEIINPSRSKEFYNLVRPRGGGGGEITPHVNRCNFFGFEDFLTKLWGHLEKSITQVWVVKYFWNVTLHRSRHQWRQRRHILRHGF